MRPVYELTINENDETGLTFNALVDVPAHMKPFVAFGKGAAVKYHFREEERMVVGVMMAANQLIYRNGDKTAPDHDVFFKPHTIASIRKKFHRQQLGRALNEMHDPKRKIAGVYMVDSYLIGGDKNPSAPKVFEDLNLQDGSWIASYHIENDDVWAKVKRGEFMGFSVEGVFDRNESKVTKKAFQNQKQNMAKNTKTLWSFVFGSEATDQTFAEATTADGVVVYYEGDLAEGTAVFVEVDGERIPAPEGPHQIEVDGAQMVITLDAAGIVVSVEDVTADEDMSEETPVKAGDFKSVMSKFQKMMDEKLSEANVVIKAQAERIKQLEDFQKSKFNYEPKKTAGSGAGSYKDLLNKKK
jgi:hypothetical protein